MHVNNGASPLEASGGRTVRRGLNRGGNRRANRALHGIVANRMCGGERIGRYIAGRMFEGKSKRDAMRCLERRVSERHAGSCSPRPPGDTPTVPSWPQGGNVSAPPPAGGRGGARNQGRDVGAIGTERAKHFEARDAYEALLDSLENTINHD